VCRNKVSFRRSARKSYNILLINTNVNFTTQ
jgi:hypothetical protein